MRVVLDTETDGLLDTVTRVWVAVARDLDTGEVHVFDGEDLTNGKFKTFCESVCTFIGHNFIEFDHPVLDRILGIRIPNDKIIDTYVVSQLHWQQRPNGHSLEAWGNKLGYPKRQHDEWDRYTPEMRNRCITDVELNTKVYEYLAGQMQTGWDEALKLEHEMAFICREMHENGFKFDIEAARRLEQKLTDDLRDLDERIASQFHPKLVAVRTVTPKLTKHGTISRTSIPREVGNDLSIFSEGAAFTWCEVVPFNAGSPKQVIERLNEFGWKPVDKTDGYIDAEREYKRAYVLPKEDREALEKKLAKFAVHGWKLNERNLATLPPSAPEAARLLVKRGLIAARLRTLAEWTASYNPRTGCVHGTFRSLGTWTHRIAHVKPNLGNVAAKKSIKYNTPELKKLAIELGGTMRGFWTCDTDRRDHTYCLEFIREGQPTNTLSTQEIGSWKRDGLILKESIGRTEIPGSSISTELVSKTLREWLSNKRVPVSCVRERGENSWLITVIQRAGLEDSYVATVMHSLVGMRINEMLLKDISLMETEDAGEWLVSTDMDSAHMRIFAHLVDDQELAASIDGGDKDKGTDAHTINMLKWGGVCPDRDRSKTFIYTFFNGGGIDKVTSIFGCSRSDAKRGMDTFIAGYPRLREYKATTFPEWADRGYFEGLDGRKVACTSAHLMMAGILQNYEAVLMRQANVLWRKWADAQAIEYRQVNLVHDEFVTAVRGDRSVAETLGRLQADAITEVGIRNGLRCPLRGGYQIGKTWVEVH